VLERLSRSDAERRAVAGELENLKAAAAVLAPIEPQVVRRTLRGYVDEWHAMIKGNVAEARRLFELVLRDRIRFRPVDGEDGAPSFELTVPIAFDRLLVSVVPSLQVRVASLTFASWNQMTILLRQVDALRLCA
jgi:hypothetical protein